MIDDDYTNQILALLGKEGGGVQTASYPPPSDQPVLAEIPISGVQLHQIATGQATTIGQPGETFAVRFLLRNSFKSGKSNFVVNNFVMQVIAIGKDKCFRKEDMAVRTKVQVVDKKREDEEEFEFTREDIGEPLF